jgi:hypothetical protein
MVVDIAVHDKRDGNPHAHMLMTTREIDQDGFGKKARADIAARFDRAMEIVHKAEAGIPAHYWVTVPDKDLPAFDELFLSVRLKLRDDVGAYDASMLSALRKLRCAKDPARSECVEKKE